ncbi:MAG: ABC transporter substrate-binding protein [Syntrophomonadaceae bacterium]|nr:ABC transporter substrate-binding protein [Syntrophomonadaceae bacterium]
MKKRKSIIAFLLMTVLLLTLAGCGAKEQTATAPQELTKVNIGYFGTTCEAPIYAAYENGYFKEEGLEVTLVKGDASTLKDGLATGKIDATDGLISQWMKPVEAGLNIKFTAGLHTGCVQVLVPADSKITSFKDLKGKRIGIPAIGSAGHVVAARMLFKEGIDSQTDVEWRVFPNAELPLVMEKGEVDVIAVADPFAQIQVDGGKAKSIYDSALDAPFKDEYCCLVVINGPLIEKDPETAAAITRALMKGAEWVSQNQEAIAQIEVDKKYVPGDAATNARILSHYNYKPSVEGGAQALLESAKEMKAIKLLNQDTDAEALAKASFVKLPGVND